MDKQEWEKRQDPYEEVDQVHLGTLEITIAMDGFGKDLHSQGGGWAEFRRFGRQATDTTENERVRAGKHSS